MKVYTHLKLEERETLFAMKQKDMTQSAVARIMGRHKSTISREIKRNRYNDLISYLPDKAHAMARDRKHVLTVKMEQFKDIRALVIERLQCKWSPDAIAGRLRIDNIFKISTETIYQYIYSDAGQALGLYKYLATKRKKRNKRHERKTRKIIIPERVSVHVRPEAANQRLEAGHFEGDLTFFKGNQSSNIMVVTERVSRFSLLIKNDSKNAKEVGKNLFNALAPVPQSIRKSITFDNGGEFVNHRLARDFLGIDTYFCDPHSPWQKGQVEKTNAMLHRFIPKSASLTPFEEISLKNIQNQFNSVPRKILGYKTPAEIFNQLLQDVALRT